jgi:hypothetical protein
MIKVGLHLWRRAGRQCCHSMCLSVYVVLANWVYRRWMSVKLSESCKKYYYFAYYYYYYY